jgi:hypothetical protein
VPIQDPYGRWLSDDGRHVWNGYQWQPAYAPVAAPARRSSALPWILGASVGMLVLLLVFGGCTYAMVNSPSFQHGYYNGYCSSYDKSHPDQPCPLSPPP